MSAPATRPQPGIRDIVVAVGREFALDAAVLTGPRRHPRTAAARFSIAWLADRHLGAGPTRIGRALGGRDHSTIAHALRRAEALRAADADYCRRLDDVGERLFGRRAGRVAA